VWLRENAAGLQRERWFHRSGCRRWLTIERDTTTNEIIGSA
jgi:heterotetrameric sarcosine oxidase delta subunit